MRAGRFTGLIALVGLGGGLIFNFPLIVSILSVYLVDPDSHGGLIPAVLYGLFAVLFYMTFTPLLLVWAIPWAAFAALLWGLVAFARSRGLAVPTSYAWGVGALVLAGMLLALLPVPISTPAKLGMGVPSAVLAYGAAVGAIVLSRPRRGWSKPPLGLVD